MEQKSPSDIQAALAMPFAPEDLEWRLQQSFEDKMRGIAVPYVTNRAIQSRLDEVVGPNNWYNEYKPWHKVGSKDSQLCGISIYFEGQGFVTKWDGAEDSDIEPVKGGLSDSMKRAAVQWGIGRVLYNMDTVFVDIERKGKTTVIKSTERGKLDQAYLNMLKRLGLAPAPAGGLQSLLAPKTNRDTSPKAAAAARQGDSGATAARSIQTASGITPEPVGKPMPTTVTAPSGTLSAAVPVTAVQEGAVPYEYTVSSAKLQKGMSAENTQVVLTTPNGKRIQAFARGVHPALQAGVKLKETRLTMRKKDTVVFYVLEDYRIVAPPQQAA